MRTGHAFVHPTECVPRENGPSSRQQPSLLSEQITLLTSYAKLISSRRSSVTVTAAPANGRLRAEGGGRPGGKGDACGPEHY